MPLLGILPMPQMLAAFSGVWILTSEQDCAIFHWVEPRAAQCSMGIKAAQQATWWCPFSLWQPQSTTVCLFSLLVFPDELLMVTHGEDVSPVALAAKKPLHEQPGLLLGCKTGTSRVSDKIPTTFKRFRISVPTTGIVVWSPHQPNVLFALVEKSIPQYSLSSH